MNYLLHVRRERYVIRIGLHIGNIFNVMNEKRNFSGGQFGEKFFRTKVKQSIEKITYRIYVGIRPRVLEGMVLCNKGLETGLRSSLFAVRVFEQASYN